MSDRMIVQPHPAFWCYCPNTSCSAEVLIRTIDPEGPITDPNQPILDVASSYEEDAEKERFACVVAPMEFTCPDCGTEFGLQYGSCLPDDDN